MYLYYGILMVEKALVAQMVKNLPAIWQTRVRTPGGEEPLEKGMATHSSILAWKIPWTEDPGRLQSTGSQKESDIAAEQQQLWASSHLLGSSQTMLMFGRNQRSIVKQLSFN